MKTHIYDYKYTHALAHTNTYIYIIIYTSAHAKKQSHIQKQIMFQIETEKVPEKTVSHKVYMLYKVERSQCDNRDGGKNIRQS